MSTEGAGRRGDGKGDARGERKRNIFDHANPGHAQTQDRVSWSLAAMIAISESRLSAISEKRAMHSAYSYIS